MTFLSLLWKSGQISLRVDQHYISLYVPHHLMFHFATLSNFLLGRNYFSLMYCLYIRKCQNLQECEGLQGDLGAPRGGQKIPADVTRASANRAAASVGGVRLRTREGTKETLTPGCVTIRWHYKTGQTLHRVGLAPCTMIPIWPLQAFAVTHRPLVGQVPGLPGHRSCELSGVGSNADWAGVGGE